MHGENRIKFQTLLQYETVTLHSARNIHIGIAAVITVSGDPKFQHH
jgi:hypothetical protein